MFIQSPPRYSHSDHLDKVFILADLNDTEATFEHRPLFDSAEQVKEKLDSLKKWKPTKKEPTMMCPQHICISRLPHNVDIVKKEIDKTMATHLLMQAYMSHKVADESLLGFATHPSNLFLLKKIKKKDLKLYPFGNCLPVAEKDQTKVFENTKNVLVWFKDKPYLVQPFKNLSSFTKPEAGTLCPYFWVKSSEEEEEINLQTVWVNFQGLQIPTLQNEDAIPEHSVLLKSSEQQPHEPPAKKARSS